MTVKQQPTTPPSGSIKSLTVPLAPEVPPPVAGGEGLTVAEAARRLIQFGPNLSRDRRPLPSAADGSGPARESSGRDPAGC